MLPLSAQEAARDWESELEALAPALARRDPQAMASCEALVVELVKGSIEIGEPTRATRSALVQALPAWLAAIDARADPETHGRALAEAAELLHAARDPWLAHALAPLLAQRELEAGRIDAALAAIERVLADYPEGGAPALRNRVTRAQLLRGAHRPDEALAALDELEPRIASEASLDEAGRNALRSQLLRARGETQAELGLPELAWLSLEGALEAAQAAGPAGATLVPLTRRSFADLDLLLEDFEDALAQLDSAERDPGYAALPPRLRLKFDVQRGAVLSEMEREDGGREPAAALRLEQAVAAPELEDDDRDFALDKLFDLALRTGELEAARARLEAQRELATPGSPARWRVRLAVGAARLALAEGGRDAIGDARAPLESAFGELVEEWERTPLRRGGLGLLENGDVREALETLVRVLVAGPGAEKALEVLLAAEARGSVFRELGLRPATPAQVRAELLPAGWGALYCLASKEHSFALAITRDDVRCYELPALDELARPIAELRRVWLGGAASADDARVAKARAAAAELSRRMLPRELADALAAWKGAIVVGADLFRALPFEALSLPDGRRFGEALAVENLPSFALGLHLAQRTSPGERAAFALVAANEPDPSLAERHPTVTRFEFGEREARELSKPYGDAVGLVALGGGATLGALARAGRGARVLQVFAHGLPIVERERSPALALAPSETDATEHGLAGCAEIETLELGCELAVLAACGGARGAPRRGDDELPHLAGAFLRAGARAVVLAQGDLELGASEILLARLHERLAAGDAPAEALRAARARLAKARGERGALEAAQFQLVGVGSRAIAFGKDSRR